MNIYTIGIVLVGMIILLITAEVMSHYFKIHSDKFYVIFHFAGGALSFLLFLNLFNNKLLAFFLVLVIGILWEIHEWILWKLSIKTKLYKPKSKDTICDLVMDISGALIFYVIEILHIF